MTKLKRWIYNKFLPEYWKEDLLKVNAQLLKTVEAQRQKIDRLNAYISGMETVLRHQRHVTVRNEVKRE